MARRMILVVAAFGICCTPAFAASARRGVLAMGTVLDVEVRAPAAQRAQELAEGVVTVVRHWDDVLSTWKPEAELERLNRHAGRWVFLSPDLRSAFTVMESLSLATRGAFDPAVGALVREPCEEDCHRPPTPFSSAVQLGASAARTLVPLDSGAIGKGIALDAATRWLLTAGAEAAFLNFGGSSQTFVSRNDRESRQIAVPRLGSEVPLGIVHLRGASLSSSRTPADPESGEIIDPATGRAVTLERMATVCTLQAADADAWSTALVVLGVRGLELAEAQGVRAVLQEGSRWFATSSWQYGDGAAARDGFSPCQFQWNKEPEVASDDRMFLPSD